MVCGWSNSLKTQKDVFFALGEMVVSMTIGRGLFISSTIKTDPIGRLLNEKFIGKFWSTVFSRRKALDKKAQDFSEEFKQIVGGLLLQKLKDFELIKMKTVELEEVQKEVESNEKKMEEAKKQKFEKSKLQHQECSS